MKKIMFILPILLLLIPNVYGAVINPSNIEISGKTNSVLSGTMTVVLNNESCSPTINSILPIYGLPTFTNSTGTYLVNFTIPTYGVDPGTYNATISYCNAKTNVVLTVSQSTSSLSCPTYVKIYGEKIPGKTIKFDIRNSEYERVRNEDTVITIQSSDTGNSYEVDCPDGSCSWQIPQTEKGTLMLDVVVPKCNVISSQIELKPAGQIEISVPTKVRMGEDFYIYLFDPHKGALSYVNVQVISPNGDVFNGKTNENGVLYDTSLTKVYGKDIKPAMIGTYKIYASMLGYETVNKTFDVSKVDCPYECCVNETGYNDKPCQSGYTCSNNKCVEIVKPKLKINCSEAVVDQEVDCYLYSDNKNITDTLTGTLYYNGEINNITFENGKWSTTFKKVGSFKITVKSDKYETGIYKGKVEPPSINATPFIAIILVVVVAVLIYFAYRKGLFKKKSKIDWDIESTGPMYPIEEE